MLICSLRAPRKLEGTVPPKYNPRVPICSQGHRKCSMKDCKNYNCYCYSYSYSYYYYSSYCCCYYYYYYYYCYCYCYCYYCYYYYTYYYYYYYYYYCNNNNSTTTVIITIMLLNSVCISVLKFIVSLLFSGNLISYSRDNFY